VTRTRPPSAIFAVVALAIGTVLVTASVAKPAFLWKGLTWLAVSVMHPPKGVKLSWAQICFLSLLLLATAIPLLVPALRLLLGGVSP